VVKHTHTHTYRDTHTHTLTHVNPTWERAMVKRGWKKCGIGEAAICKHRLVGE
jgi:hypothetical protein